MPHSEASFKARRRESVQNGASSVDGAHAARPAHRIVGAGGWMLSLSWSMQHAVSRSLTDQPEQNC